MAVPSLSNFRVVSISVTDEAGRTTRHEHSKHATLTEARKAAAKIPGADVQKRDKKTTGGWKIMATLKKNPLTAAEKNYRETLISEGRSLMGGDAAVKEAYAASLRLKKKRTKLEQSKVVGGKIIKATFSDGKVGYFCGVNFVKGTPRFDTDPGRATIYTHLINAQKDIVAAWLKSAGFTAKVSAVLPPKI